MFPRLQLPTEGELSPSEINSLISTANTIRKIDLESRAAARRYRGQQQLQALIGQGVPMDQAMQRVAGDLFYQQPQYQTQMWRQMEIDRRTQQRHEQNMIRLDEVIRHNRETERLRAEADALKLTPEQREESERRKADYGIFKQGHMKALQNKALAEKALRTFQGNAMTGQMLASKDPATEAQLEEKKKALQDAQDELDSAESLGVKLGHLKPEHVSSKNALPEFKNDKEQKSWMNAKDAIVRGVPKQQVIKLMQEHGYTVEGL